MGIKSFNVSRIFTTILLTVLILIGSSSLLAQTWQPLGPSPLLGGQSENIPNTPVIGAIHGIAPHPSNADILYIASVNGGIWKTTNATAANPTWVAQTDSMPSLSMSDIEFDTTDATFQTLVAGSGRFSSLAGIGGNRAGIMRTTNGGSTWTLLGSDMVGRNITSVEARGNILLASVDYADDNFCANLGLFRSTNTGVSWSQLATAQGITPGRVSALSADPSNPAIFYAGIFDSYGSCTSNTSLISGIYKSTDTGASWNKISDNAMDAIILSNNCHFEIAVGSSNSVFVSMVCTGGELEAVFHSSNGGGIWTAMDIPTTTETIGSVGIHPGGQGNLHSSLTVDPSNNNIVYIGGDRQPDALDTNGNGTQFPNSIGARNYSGRLFRGDVSQTPGSQWTPITHSGTASNSAPHADSRELRFDAAGSLLEVDDGGIYRNNTPISSSGDWINVNGDLKITEQHSTAYDNNSAITISGNQDNGSSRQNLFTSTTWNNIQGGDGGDVIVDTVSLAGSNQSVRYFSSQNLAGLRRITYDQNNGYVAQSYLSLTVVNGGAALVPQFITPLAFSQNASILNGNIRLIIGAGNSIYESLDQGDTITEIGPGIMVRGVGRTNIAYGATGNPDILYVGACQGNCGNSGDGLDGIFVRTSSGGALTHVYPASGNGRIQGVVVHPGDPAQAFLIENAKVMRTIDTGANWTDITGNLTGFGQLRSIAYMPGIDNGLAVGTNTGVFISRASGGYSTWVTPATGMPNTPVFDLQYDPPSARLVAGTLGRGAFVLTGALGSNSPPVAGADAINLAKGATATVLVGGSSSLLNNDSDPNAGDTLTVSTTATVAPTNGLLTLAADGTFSYQHDGSLTSSDQFFYRVCDNGTPVFCADGQVDITIDLGPNVVCSSPNVAIPDANANGVTDTLTVTPTGSITDLNVFVEINHTYVGDLEITLTDVSTSTSVVVISQPGTSSCGNADISVALDDEATGQADDQCSATPPAIGGSFKPTNPLTGFDGKELSGNWTLKVADFAGGDTGALISWCLEPTITGGTPQAPVLASIGNKNINEQANLTFTATATDTDTVQGNLVFSLSGQPTGATISTGGAFSFTPTEAQGPNTYTFDVIVTDDTSPTPLTDSETIIVTVAEVNQNPVLAAIGNKTIVGTTTLNFTATATDGDLPTQGLTYTLSGQPTGASITTAGQFSFTPTLAQLPGSYTFDVIVTDDGAGQLTDSETITVAVVNDDVFKNGFE